jgi:hypothetical protein
VAVWSLRPALRARAHDARIAPRALHRNDQGTLACLGRSR